MPDLEDRVAALEDVTRQIAAQMGIPPDVPMTEEQAAEFRRQFDEAVRGKPFEYRILPSPPPLTPEQVRQLLRECVTVVKPGEHLILRIPWTTTPTQVRELQDFVTDTAVWLDLPFKVLVLPGDGLAVAEPGGVPGAP